MRVGKQKQLALWLVLKIAILTAIVELTVAYFFPNIDIFVKDLPLFSQIFQLLGAKNYEVHEAFVSSCILIFIVGPVIYFAVINPYTREQNQQKAKAQKIFFQNESMLNEQKRLLEEAIAHATENLKNSEERYALAALGANDGLWDYDLVTKNIFFSERWKEIIGFHKDEIKNDFEEWHTRIHGDDKPLFKTMIDSSLIHGKEKHFECEYRIRAKDESFKWVLSRWVTVFDKENKPVRMVGSQTDITDRKRMESQLLHDALHDILTGLPNRSLLNDRLKQAINRYIRHPKRRFALLFIDLDHFKRINDTLGHTAGDHLLIEIGKRLEKSIRSSDTVARLGGDEFAILIEDYESQPKLEQMLDRLYKNVTKPVKIRQSNINPSISIGVVISDKHHRKSTFEDMISDADLALYKAKESGKGRFAIFDISMRTEVSKQFEIGNNLKGAMERGEVSLFYQPIVNLQTRQIAGFEALMRWNHPRFGWVPPSSFIPIAEESDIIHDLGKFALDEGCRQLKAWQTEFSKPDWFMSINVSPRQFNHNDLLDCIERAIAEGKIAPNTLKIEVTETLLMSQGDRALWMLNQMKKRGIKLAIDDFGVGYSSLSTLYQFPFDTLKIDRSFINEISHNSKSQDMVRLICMLAKTLGMKAVAEGIEIKEQLDFIQSMGCQFGQGYYMSRPLPAEEVASLLSSGTDYQVWVSAANPKKQESR